MSESTSNSQEYITTDTFRKLAGVEAAGSPIIISGFWRRIVAFILDILIIGAIGYILGLLLFDVLAGLAGWGCLLGLAIAGGYFGILNSEVGSGQTIGKKIMRIKVIDRHGYFIPLARSFLRFSIFALLFLAYHLMEEIFPNSDRAQMALYAACIGIGTGLIYMYLFNSKTRQSMHDLLASTLVVKASVGEGFSIPPMNRLHIFTMPIVVVLGSVLFYLFLTRGTQTAISLLGIIEPQFDVEIVEQQLDQIEGIWFPDMQIHEVYTPSVDTPDGKFNYMWALVAVKNKQLLDTTGDSVGKRVARIYMKNTSNIDSFDRLIIIICYGYDIGIASSWRFNVMDHSPAEWRSKLFTM